VGKLCITSDGTAHGTKVMTESGEVIDGVSLIRIHPIQPRGILSAEITVWLGGLEVTVRDSVEADELLRLGEQARGAAQ
jgi:hypothetical protein